MLSENIKSLLGKIGLGGGLTSMFGGEDPKPLTPQQMKDWNSYVTWLEGKGMGGSKELDKGDAGLKWLDMYIKENPGTTLSRDIIPSIQTEVDNLSKNIRTDLAKRNDPRAATAMTGTSKVDGIPGSRTTSFKFPVFIEQSYHNGQLVSRENLGLMGADLRPRTGTASGMLPGKVLPKGAKLERLKDGVFYEDPDTGDLVKWSD